MKIKALALTTIESLRLAELEEFIEAGRQTFVEVGLALAEIRDTRLYRAEYDSFDSYCKSKWGWRKGHCYRLIAAAAVKNSIGVKGVLLSNESQVRELARVPEERRVEIMELAEEPLTARSIRRARETLFPPPVADSDQEQIPAYGPGDLRRELSAILDRVETYFVYANMGMALLEFDVALKRLREIKKQKEYE